MKMHLKMSSSKCRQPFCPGEAELMPFWAYWGGTALYTSQYNTSGILGVTFVGQRVLIIKRMLPSGTQ